MPEFHLLIADHREGEVTIDVGDSAEAMNAGFNALAQFVCRNFPPPENVEITVSDSNKRLVGRLRMTFEVNWAGTASG
jgi:uncharacterized protein with PhoU and TrkA domain